MFNRSRFNLQRYNLPAGGEFDAYIRETMMTLFNAMVTNGGNSYIVLVANEGFGSKADGASGVMLGTMAAVENVHAGAAGYVIFYTDAYMEERAGSCVQISQDALIIVSLDALVGAKATAGNNLFDVIPMETGFSRYAEASKNYVSPPIAFSSVVDAQVTTFEFSIGYATLTLTLAPGDTVVIDSDNFVVLHNGENAIDKHTGIWPELTRETFDIQVSSGTLADLVTSILFTERYL